MTDDSLCSKRNIFTATYSVFLHEIDRGSLPSTRRGFFPAYRMGIGKNSDMVGNFPECEKKVFRCMDHLVLRHPSYMRGFTYPFSISVRIGHKRKRQHIPKLDTIGNGSMDQCRYTVRRPVVKFHSTAQMYMDQSLPGTESVFCFWPVLNPAPQCNFPMASENFIVEPFHGQEFSTNADSQTWNFPLVLYINGIFRWCSFHWMSFSICFSFSQWGFSIELS